MAQILDMRWNLGSQTCTAEPVNLEYMRQNFALHAFDHKCFNFLFRAEMKVLNLAAGNADKVMVMLFIPAEVIVELSIRMENAGYDVAFIKFVEDTVHGRKANTFEPLLHLLPDRFRAQVYLFVIKDL